MDIERSIATRNYIDQELLNEEPTTPRLFKAGLLTRQVSRKLKNARQEQQNSGSTSVDLAGSTPHSLFGDQ